MRVTQRLLFNNFMRDININRSEAGRLQSDISSGKKIRVPSQGPIEFQRARLTEENIRKEEQFQDNIDSGLRQGRLAQETLDNIIDRLIGIKEIAVNGGSDSYGASDRISMANQISGIKKTIASALNLTYGDRYLFAGTNSENQPFTVDETTGVVTNNSNATAPKVKAGDGVDIEFSITGQEITDTPTGELFQLLDDLEAAFRANDSDQIRVLSQDVDQSIMHVTEKASKLGNNINRLEFMYEQYESSKITQTAQVSELVDTDVVQALSNMKRNQVAYEAAMAVHSNMFRSTLLDYL